MKIGVGNQYLFVTQDSSLEHKNNELVSVKRPLTEKEADLDVGPMYKVTFANGKEIDAFEDELREYQPCHQQRY